MADMKKLTPTRIQSTIFSVREAAPLGLGIRLTACLLVGLATSSSLLACAADVRTDGASDSGSSGSGGASPGGASSGSAGSGGAVSMWPKRVTIVTPAHEIPSDGVKLADGAIVAGGGDLKLWQAYVLSLRSPTQGSLCVKGEFAALRDIPTELDTCPGALAGTWSPVAYLSAASQHTSEESYVIGLGLLVWNKEHTALFRLRVVGDSFDKGAATATFDYEPAP